jgi:HEAT repeat protein
LAGGVEHATFSANPSCSEGRCDNHAEAVSFLQRFLATSTKRRSSVAAGAPIVQLQAAALQHRDPFMRRSCLGYLDHHANEDSISVFALALRDPVELVRHTALHSLACETCRTEELCPADVVPHVVEVLFADPSPELRHKAIPVLLRLADRDPRARQALEQAANNDVDALVREVAHGALAGRHVRSRRAYERRVKRKRTPV